MLNHCLSLFAGFVWGSRAGTSLSLDSWSGDRRGATRYGPGVGPCGSACWTSSGIIDPLVGRVQEPLIASRTFWRCSGGTSMAGPPPKIRGESPPSFPLVAITGMTPELLVASAVMMDGGAYCRGINVPNGGLRGGIVVSGCGMRRDGGRRGYVFKKTGWLSGL